jgi:hypothetical protein
MAPPGTRVLVHEKRLYAAPEQPTPSTAGTSAISLPLLQSLDLRYYRRTHCRHILLVPLQHRHPQNLLCRRRLRHQCRRPRTDPRSHKLASSLPSCDKRLATLYHFANLYATQAPVHLPKVKVPFDTAAPTPMVPATSLTTYDTCSSNRVTSKKC